MKSSRGQVVRRVLLCIIALGQFECIANASSIATSSSPTALTASASSSSSSATTTTSLTMPSTSVVLSSALPQTPSNTQNTSSSIASISSKTSLPPPPLASSTALKNKADMSLPLVKAAAESFVASSDGNAFTITVVSSVVATQTTTVMSGVTVTTRTQVVGTGSSSSASSSTSSSSKSTSSSSTTSTSTSFSGLTTRTAILTSTWTSRTSTCTTTYTTTMTMSGGVTVTGSVSGESALAQSGSSKNSTINLQAISACAMQCLINIPGLVVEIINNSIFSICTKEGVKTTVQACLTDCVDGSMVVPLLLLSCQYLAPHTVAGTAALPTTRAAAVTSGTSPTISNSYMTIGTTRTIIPTIFWLLLWLTVLN